MNHVQYLDVTTAEAPPGALNVTHVAMAYSSTHPQVNANHAFMVANNVSLATVKNVIPVWMATIGGLIPTTIAARVPRVMLTVSLVSVLEPQTVQISCQVDTG